MQVEDLQTGVAAALRAKKYLESEVNELRAQLEICSITQSEVKLFDVI